MKYDQRKIWNVSGLAKKVVKACMLHMNLESWQGRLCICCHSITALPNARKDTTRIRDLMVSLLLTRSRQVRRGTTHSNHPGDDDGEIDTGIMRLGGCLKQ